MLPSVLGGGSDGTKCSLEKLWKLLSLRDIDVNQLWEDIKVVVLKCLACADEQIPHCEQAFEMFGFDVIIDDSLRPWLLEVNASPMMHMVFFIVLHAMLLLTN